MGGDNGVASVFAVQIFNPSLGVWSSGASMLDPRDLLAAVPFNGSIYVIGGGAGTDLSAGELFTPPTPIYSYTRN
jgi:hypothetical protein